MPRPIDQVFDESFEIGNTAPVERGSLAEDRSDFGELSDHTAGLDDLTVASAVAISDARDITAAFLVEAADGPKKTKKWCDHCQVNHWSTTVCPYIEQQKKEKGEGSTTPKPEEATAPSKAVPSSKPAEAPSQAAGKGAKPDLETISDALSVVPVPGWSAAIGDYVAQDLYKAFGNGNLLTEKSLNIALGDTWPNEDIHAVLKVLKDKGYLQQQGDALLLTTPGSTGETGQTETAPATPSTKLSPAVLAAALAGSGLQPGMADSMSKVLLKQFTSKSPDGSGVSIPLKKLVTTLVEAHGWQPTPTTQGLQALLDAGVLLEDGNGGISLSMPAEAVAAVGGPASGKPLPQKTDGAALAKSMGLHVKSLGHQTLALLGEKAEPLDLKQVYDLLGLQGKFEGFVKPKLVPLLTHLVEEGKLQKIDVPGGETKYFFGSFEQPLTEEQPPAKEAPSAAPGAVEEVIDALEPPPEPAPVEEPSTGQPEPVVTPVVEPTPEGIEAAFAGAGLSADHALDASDFLLGMIDIYKPMSIADWAENIGMMIDTENLQPIEVVLNSLVGAGVLATDADGKVALGIAAPQPTGKCKIGHTTFKSPVPDACPSCGGAMEGGGDDSQPSNKPESPATSGKTKGGLDKSTPMTWGHGVYDKVEKQLSALAGDDVDVEQIAAEVYGAVTSSPDATVGSVVDLLSENWPNAEGIVEYLFSKGVFGGSGAPEENTAKPGPVPTGKVDAQAVKKLFDAALVESDNLVKIAPALADAFGGTYADLTDLAEGMSQKTGLPAYDCEDDLLALQNEGYIAFTDGKLTLGPNAAAAFNPAPADQGSAPANNDPPSPVDVFSDYLKTQGDPALTANAGSISAVLKLLYGSGEPAPDEPGLITELQAAGIAAKDVKPIIQGLVAAGVLENKPDGFYLVLDAASIQKKKDQPVTPGTTIPATLTEKIEALNTGCPAVDLAAALQVVNGATYPEIKQIIQQAFEAAGKPKPDGMGMINVLESIVDAGVLKTALGDAGKPVYTINPAFTAAQPTGVCPDGHKTYKVPVPHNCPSCGKVMIPNKGFAPEQAAGNVASPDNPKPIQDALKASMGNAAGKMLAKAICETLKPGGEQDTMQLIEALSEASGIDEADVVAAIEELIAAGVLKSAGNGGAVDWPTATLALAPTAFNPTPIAKALEQLGINPGGKSITFLKTLNSKGADGLTVADAVALQPDPPSGTPKINLGDAVSLISKALEKGLISKVPNTAPPKYIFGNIGGPVEDKRVKTWDDALKALGIDKKDIPSDVENVLIEPDGTINAEGAQLAFAHDEQRRLFAGWLTNHLIAKGLAETVTMPDGSMKFKLKGYAPPAAPLGPPAPLAGSHVPKGPFLNTAMPVKLPKEVKAVVGQPKQRPEPPTRPAPSGVTTTEYETAHALGLDLHDPVAAAKWDASKEKKIVAALDTHARLGKHFPGQSKETLQKLVSAGVVTCTDPESLYDGSTDWKKASFIKRPLRRALDSAVDLPPASEIRYSLSADGEVTREIVMAPEVADSIKAFRELMPNLGDTGEAVLQIMSTDPGKSWTFDELSQHTGIGWTNLRKLMRSVSIELVQRIGQGDVPINSSGQPFNHGDSYGLLITGSKYGGKHLKLNTTVLMAATAAPNGVRCLHCRVKHRPATKCPWVGRTVTWTEIDDYRKSTAVPAPLPTPQKAPPQPGPSGAPLSVQAALSKLGFNSGTLGHLVISTLQNPTDMATLKAVVAQKYQKWGPDATIKKAVQAGVVEVLPDGKYALKGTGAKLAAAGLGTTTVLPTPGQMSAPIPDASPQPLEGAEDVRALYAVDHPIQRMDEASATRFHQLSQYMEKAVREHPEYDGTAPAFRSTALALDVASQMMSPAVRAIALCWAYQWKGSSDSWGGRVMGATINQVGMNSSPTAASMGNVQPGALTYEKEELLKSHGLDPKKYGNEAVRDVDLYFDPDDPDAPSLIGLDKSEMSSIHDVAAAFGVNVADIKPSVRKRRNYALNLTEKIPTWTFKGPSRKEVLLQQYAATQTALRLAKDQSIACFRGMHDEPPYNVVRTMIHEAASTGAAEGRGAKVFMNPCASWSTSGSVAAQGGFGNFQADPSDPYDKQGMGLVKDTPPYLMLYHYEQKIDSPVPSMGKSSVMASGEDEIVVLGHCATTVGDINRGRFTKISQMLPAGNNKTFVTPKPDKSVPAGFGIFVMTPDHRLYWVTAEEVILCAQDFGKPTRKPSTPRLADLSVSGAYDARLEAHV